MDVELKLSFSRTMIEEKQQQHHIKTEKHTRNYCYNNNNGRYEHTMRLIFSLQFLANSLHVFWLSIRNSPCCAVQALCFILSQFVVFIIIDTREITLFLIFFFSLALVLSSIFSMYVKLVIPTDCFLSYSLAYKSENTFNSYLLGFF